MITVTGLNVHPLKSGSATALPVAELLDTGLRHDREFMLVDAEGRFLSQRKHPSMALLRTSYDGLELEVNDFHHKAVGPEDGPGAAAPDEVGVAKRPPSGPIEHGPVVEVTVHGKPCQGVDQGEEAARFFSGFLGFPVRLVRFTGERATKLGGGRVAYEDGYPLLVIGEESLADLNARLPEPVPMARFRPNIVLSGLGPFGEDSVRRIRIGAVEIEFVKPCGRCVMTTVDQDTGVKGREPLATLARYRTVTFDGERVIAFGQNGIPRATGTLHVGQPVEVVEYSGLRAVSGPGDEDCR
ncbi:MOSC domain-containing protein [Actinocorallia sp. API 0066]|uniref:MOSC domain-containing protein n=1 Tax=Actinocorallia sp. API 0066 TaxID=2896846 RepID=UPI001E46FE3E|nr:MOSC N-terminal beta barrel domain-containing protein [Actinocorallia sp. API 0066]MCD0452593.1 MOSC domain-containing protein [Actinocorallia sp. API 0066]